MFIPTAPQMTEANVIMERLRNMTNMVRNRAIEAGRDPEEAVTKYQCGGGYTFGRIQARVLMNGGFATFRCLFEGNNMVAWEKVTVDSAHGRSRVWLLLPEYAKKFKKATVTAGGNSNDQRNMGLVEKTTMLPAIVKLETKGHERVIVKVDVMEMEYYCQ